jgi:L-threonylcarbamoyladenylate synthase
MGLMREGAGLKDTLILKVDPASPDLKMIKYAAKILKGGGLVAFPTETVYGIGANLLDEEAIERLYKVKERPGNKPFTVHIAGLSQVKSLGCTLDARAKKLAKKFWPGPLTMVVASDGGGSIGFRMPANKVALLLIKSSGVPVAAPSANLSGRKPPTDAPSVLMDMRGKIDVIIDSGPTDVGVESTVADLTVKPFKVLREGAIREKELRKILADG